MGLPKNICDSCICEAQAAFRFKQRYENSRRMLTKTLSKILLQCERIEVKVEQPEKDDHECIVKLKEKEAKLDCSKLCADYQHVVQRGTINNEHISKRALLDQHLNSTPVNIQSEVFMKENWELEEDNIELGCVKIEKNDSHSCEDPNRMGSKTIQCPEIPNKEATNKESESLTKRNHLLCPHCPKEFTQSSHLNAHIRTHTGEQPFQCTHCPRAFSQASNLRKHMCIHSGERPFKCPHCPKTFTRRTDLQYHVSTHPGKQIHKCPKCTRYFIEIAELDEHMRYHTGERSYKCTECSKEFIHPYKLKRHKETHTGDHKFKCPHCPKTCVDKGNLGRHIRSHTGERPCKCPHCPKAFSRATYLKTHMLSHNPNNNDE